MSINVKDGYGEMKKYSGTIIPDIIGILSKNNFNYSTNSNNTEIVVTEQTEDTTEFIYESICKGLSVPKIIFPLLVDVVEVDDKIYIRQKTM